jgi:DNA-binding response OmpR family regulator
VDGGADRYGPRLAIDRKAARVRLDGEEVALAPKEYDLLSENPDARGAATTRAHAVTIAARVRV